jgi:hypothetical protein
MHQPDLTLVPGTDKPTRAPPDHPNRNPSDVEPHPVVRRDHRADAARPTRQTTRSAA